MNIVKKGILTATLAATALVSTTPAMARDHRRNNDNTAAVVIGAGVVGLALGAIIASSSKKDRNRYDDRYQVRDGWYYNDGQYYNRDGRSYDRDEWSRRYGNERSSRNDRDWRGNDTRYEYGRDRDYYQRRGY